MADSRREYLVTIGGLPHTFLLDAEQAKERGLTDADLAKSAAKSARVPENKSRTPQNKSDK